MRRRAVFLDKDGTLVRNVPHNVAPDLIALSESSICGLQALAAAGYSLIVVTNQSGVSLEYFPESSLIAVEATIRSALRSFGVRLAGFYYCPHYPSGSLEPYACACACRKPAPGLLLKAAADHEVDLARSWLIGDILDDIEAGKQAGCKTVLIANGGETQWEMSEMRTPDLITESIDSAADFITGAGLN